MRLCKECWDKLRVAIEERGLMQMVGKNGDTAAKMAMERANGDESRGSYDPLMAANFAIWSHVLQATGVKFMMDSAGCPLCEKTEMEKTCTDPMCKKESGDDWIRFAADDQLAYAREKGFIPQVA